MEALLGGFNEIIMRSKRSPVLVMGVSLIIFLRFGITGVIVAVLFAATLYGSNGLPPLLPTGAQDSIHRALKGGAPAVMVARTTWLIPAGALDSIQPPVVVPSEIIPPEDISTEEITESNEEQE